MSFEQEILEVLEAGTMLVVGLVQGKLSPEEFLGQYDSFYDSNALDGHEATGDQVAVLAGLAPLCEFHRRVQEIVYLAYLSDVELPAYEAAGRIRVMTVAGRVRDLARSEDVDGLLRGLRAHAREHPTAAESPVDRSASGTTAGIEHLAAQVRDRWTSQEITVSDVRPQAILELVRRFGPLPEPYTEFLRTAGVASNDDSEGFLFWGPEEVRSTAAALNDAGYPGVDLAASSIIFADYMQESWWYALWVDGPHLGCVSLVLGQGASEPPDLQPPVGTFLEFLAWYLADDERLYRVVRGSPG